MKPAGLLLTNLLVVVGAIAVYHVLFHGGGGEPTSPEQDLSGTRIEERNALEDQMHRADVLFTPTYDEAAMRRIIERADVTLTDEQAQEILPRLHAHLVSLRKNLESARAAALAGKPDSQRVVYHARAAQMHGAFQAYLRKVLTPDDATAIFKAAPAMLPPVPGSTAAGRKKPTSDGRPTKQVIHSGEQPK